jgi:hypothetical protein
VQDYTAVVPVGGRGRVLLQLANELPIVKVEIRLGAQVIAALSGDELRDTAGMFFSVPRMPGDYPFSVFAQDSAGCSAVTSAARTVTVF